MWKLWCCLFCVCFPAVNKKKIKSFSSSCSCIFSLIQPVLTHTHSHGEMITTSCRCPYAKHSRQPPHSHHLASSQWKWTNVILVLLRFQFHSKKGKIKNSKQKRSSSLEDEGEKDSHTQRFSEKQKLSGWSVSRCGFNVHVQVTDYRGWLAVPRSWFILMKIIFQVLGLCVCPSSLRLMFIELAPSHLAPPWYSSYFSQHRSALDCCRSLKNLWNHVGELESLLYLSWIPPSSLLMWGSLGGQQ